MLRGHFWEWSGGDYAVLGMKPSLPHGKHTGRDFLWKWLEDLRIYMAKMGGGVTGQGLVWGGGQ